MKSLVYAGLLMVGMVVSVFAQNINTPENFPDPNFRAAVEQFMGVPPGGEFTAAQAAAKTDTLNCANRSITDMTGLAFFTGITGLNCTQNQLTQLDVSYNSDLKNLSCGYNKIIQLDVSQNPDLHVIWCYENQLTQLDISHNPDIEVVYCWNNQLSQLDVSQNPTLQSLYCNNNQLTQLDIFHNLDLQFLACNNNKLIQLDVSHNPALQYLYCYYNQLTQLDVSQNPALQYLACYSNQLFQLDVTHNPILQDLGCSYNQLNQLDVSQNPALQYLDCGSNQLNQLDLSHNLVLQYLDCDSNQLIQLDVSQNHALHYLSCYSNQLIQLDVSQNSDLQYLDCSSNQLTQLDLTHNPVLHYLFCYYNQLTNLDVSPNSALQLLSCGGNQLTQLDMYNNPDLYTLNCGNNQLTQLNVTNNTVLQYLYCGYNQLTQLVVSQNLALIDLYCDSNQLTQLDVSANIELQFLYCQHNQISNISRLVDNPSLGVGGAVDVRWNILDYGDWNDVQTLKNRLGDPVFYSWGYLQSGFAYSPQNNFDPYDFSNSNPEPNINTPKNFPDPNFRAAVEAFMGVSHAGVFDASQAASKSGALDCSNQNISDLTGIAFFTGLTYLYCSSNQLTSLDVSHNFNLQILSCSFNQLTSLVTQNSNLLTLYCFFNQLTSLDVSHNSNLQNLYCASNQLTSLDVSQNSNLQILYCAFNQLTTSLDVTHNTSLTGLDCSSNQLNSLDVSQNPNLQNLYCSSNQLNSLYVSQNPNLQNLYCSSNQLTSLDVSHNSNLVILFCDFNQLTSLDVSANTALLYLSCSNNQISSISSFVANSGLSAGDTVDVRWNNLDYGDWNDVQTLKSRIGDPVFYPWGPLQSGFAYSPQNGIDPYEGDTNLNAQFPDPNLLAFLQQALGVGPGGIITAELAGTFTGTLDCSNLNISDLSGIQYFTALTGLNCSGNQLTNLDLSHNLNLQTLDCSYNQLTSMDLSSNLDLQSIDLSNNNLSSLILPGRTPLLPVKVLTRKVRSLDNPNNTLTYLNVSHNSLTTLDVSIYPALETLNCSYNNLTNLDVTNNTALHILDASHNFLSDLSSFVANAGLTAGDAVDVRYNNLDIDDLNDISTLLTRIGNPQFDPNNGNLLSGFAYIPQNNPASIVYKVHWTGDVGDYQKDAYFQATLFSPPINAIVQFPAWCTDLSNLIGLDQPYPGANLITHPAPSLYSSFGGLPPTGQGVVDNPNNLPYVNWILNEYRSGSFNNIDFDSNGQTESASWREVQAAIWKYLFNDMSDVTPKGDITSGFITWNDPFAKWIYQQALGHNNFAPNSSGQVIGVIVYLGGDIQTTLCEVPFDVYQYLQLLGLI